MNKITSDAPLQVLFILKKLLMKYTKGRSSSVKKNTVISILNSIYYSVNACNYVKSDKLSALNDGENICAMYNEGINIVKNTMIKCEILYEKIKRNRLKIPVQIYNDMIDKDLPDFFKNYDVTFAADSTVSNIDYPIVFNDMSITGIFFIKQYLEKLDIETEFCNFFDQSSIRKILINYGKKHKLNIMDSPFNVFEVVLDQCFFAVLCSNDKNDLNISDSKIKMINKKFLNKSEKEIYSIIDDAFNEIIDKFNIDDLMLVNYINRYKVSFKFRFLNAYKNGNLLNMIIEEKIENKNKKIVLKQGRSMNDYEFSNIVQEIMQCQNFKDKFDIIVTNVHSLDDYMDILDSQCLFGKEYIKSFESLDDMSLSVLGRVVFYDDLICDSFDLSYEKLMEYKGSFDKEWQNYYVEFLLNMKQEKRNGLEKIINEVT